MVGDCDPPSRGESTVTAVADATPDDRTVLWYALLFSVPVGVGISAGTMRMTGGGFLTPIVAVPGVVATVCIFAFVVFAASGGPSTPENS